MTKKKGSKKKKQGARSSAWGTPAAEALRVGPGFILADVDRAGTPGFRGGRKEAEKLTERHGAELADLQERLFANGKHGDTRSVLLVLQGMDTSGKGGIVSHVIGMVDPQGVAIHGFGVPTEEEKSHDFLWRIRAALPTAGHIGVFDRSHYEDVLVVRVHELVPRDELQERYQQINEFERELIEAGTRIVKVALLVSPKEQKRRLKDRLARRDKHWKFSPNDLKERQFWPAYDEAYQTMFDLTSTDDAPWYAVPADHKWYARVAVTELLLDALRSLDLQWPTADFDVAEAKQQLKAE